MPSSKRPPFAHGVIDRRSQASAFPAGTNGIVKKVFDLKLPLEKVAERYRAMDERRAIKALLEV